MPLLTIMPTTWVRKLAFNSRNVPVEQVIQQVIATKPCLDVTITDPPLEEIIREIYQN
jgi:ABC-type uncharacterized transport system ATPase subunit